MENYSARWVIENGFRCDEPGPQIVDERALVEVLKFTKKPFCKKKKD